MSTTPLTPGIYRRPLAPVRALGRLARGDIPALLGYARRGPVGAPVRIYSLEQFEQVFGAATEHGHLWAATKGFFENGGQSAYVIRVATAASHSARAVLPATGPVRYELRAAFPWTMIDPRRLAPDDRLQATDWLTVFEEQLRRDGSHSPDPGHWANAVAVRIRRSTAAHTVSIVDGLERGAASRVASLAGIDAHSVLELTQRDPSGTLREARTIPEAVDEARSLIHWRSEEALLPCQPQWPLRITSVDFSFEFFAEQQSTLRLEGLAPHPAHPSSITTVLQSACRDAAWHPVPRRRLGTGWVDLEGEAATVALTQLDWSDPDCWPPEGYWQLSGGTDGLEQVGPEHWVTALGHVAQLPDAAMVACPDVVLGNPAPEPALVTAPRPVDCNNLAARPTAQLRGIIHGLEPDGGTRPLPRVRIEVAGTDRHTVSGTDGSFLLTGVSDTVVQLRLRHPGYTPLDVPTQGSAFASAAVLRLSMNRLTTPNALSAEQQLTVQRAMLDPVLVGPYKIALLDPPAAGATIDQLRAWRHRLGEAPRGFFTIPWLVLDGQLPCPPSGHIAGAFAAAELASGIHQPPANRALRLVQGVNLAVDALAQQDLNPEGINPVRSFAGRGLRLHGTRSLSVDPAWQFITVRRLLDAIEKSLLRLLQPVVFEPNNELLWHCAVTTIEAFLGRLHQAGMLAGDSAPAAFTVRCDEQVNPPAARDAGQMVIEVAVAPTVPYEFITFRIGHAYDALRITEEG